jgi:hypothetical protein
VTKMILLYSVSNFPTGSPHDTDTDTETNTSTTSPLLPLKTAYNKMPLAKNPFLFLLRLRYHSTGSYHHDLQEPSHIPSPRLPASTTTRKVPFHHTTTIAWLRQLTRKQTRWKHMKRMIPHRTTQKRLFSTPHSYTTTAKDVESHCHS